MIVTIYIVSYLAIGFCLARIIHNKMVDRSVQEQLEKNRYYENKYPSGKWASKTESEKLQEVLREAKSYDEVNWQMMAALSFFFWPVIAPAFSIKRSFDMLSNSNVKFLGTSKIEKRIAELQELEDSKKKYAEALKVLKAAGIKIGE